MNYQRPIFADLFKRLNEKRKFIQTIVGPRQVGKTTLVNQMLKKIKFPHLYISADEPGAVNQVWLRQYWESARQMLRQSSAKTFILAIDEIQKIHNWSEIVKLEWDYDTNNNINIIVVILGSSTLLLEKGLTESLAGRFEKTYLPHWSFNEMNAAFGISPEQFVWFGGYPGAANLLDDEFRFKKYIKDSLIETTISKDILMLTRIDKPALLKQLFELGCLFSGQIVSYNKLLGQLQDAGNTITLSHYLSLLNSAGLLTGMQKYSGKLFRKRASSPKFQVHNTALVSALLQENFNEIIIQPLKWGRIVESAIGAHLINYSKTNDFNVYYWRHRNDEIDFAISYKNKLLGLEIKTGYANKTRGMQVFENQFDPDKVVIVSSNALSWQELLKINPIELF